MSGPQQLLAADVDALINSLAWVRSQMLPQIPQEDLKVGTTVSSIPAVRWQVTEGDTPGQFRLFLLHPGFGWSHIYMDRASFEQMANYARMLLQAGSSKQ